MNWEQCREHMVKQLNKFFIVITHLNVLNFLLIFALGAVSISLFNSLCLQSKKNRLSFNFSFVCSLTLMLFLSRDSFINTEKNNRNNTWTKLIHSNKIYRDFFSLLSRLFVVVEHKEIMSKIIFPCNNTEEKKGKVWKTPGKS